jgi:Uma2 family endonuclease
MAHPAPADPRMTAERYFRLVEDGLLAADDRVELLEGVVVAMPPMNPPHAGVSSRINEVLVTLLAGRATVRPGLSLSVGRYSVPEPDFAVVERRDTDWVDMHPTHALLVIEVADSSLPQDRLTKAPIYAAAGIAQYLIVNLRQDCVEVNRVPDVDNRRYRETRIARRGERIALDAFPDLDLLVSDLLPRT